MTICAMSWALTWEYWRRGAFWLVASIAGAVIGATSALYAPLLLVTGFRYTDLRAELDAGLVALIILPPLVLVTAAFAASRRQYALPVTTPLLVGTALVNGAAATICVYGMVTLVLGSLFSVGWPLLLPALWAATTYIVLQSLVWQIGRSRGLFVLLVLLFLMGAMYLGAEYLLPHLLSPERQAARTGQYILGELCLVHVPIWVAAYLVGINGVARERRGNDWSLDWLVQGWRRWCGRAATATVESPRRSFRSPQAAQFWYEWHTKGRLVVLGVLVVVAGVGVRLCFQPNPQQVEDVLGGLSGLLLALVPLIGLFLGSEAGRFDRRAFAATRPLSDGDLAAAVLKNVAAVVASCGAMWLIVFAGAWLISCIGVGASASASDWQSWQEAWASGLPAVVQRYGHLAARLLLVPSGILLGVWTVMGLGAALALSRAWFVAVGGGSCLVLFVTLLVSLIRTQSFVFAFVVLGLLGTVAAFVAASRLGVMSHRRLLSCCAAYGLLCIASLWAARTLDPAGPLPLSSQVLIVGLCAMPLAPLAAAPWALHWNRHR